MQNIELTKLITFKNDSILDMDFFIKKLSEIKEKKVRPDLIGSIITHYASKWLPELAGDEANRAKASSENFSESITVSLTKKRFIIESLVEILPPEKDSIPCNFLLRLLCLANMVRVDPLYVSELETRVSWQLDQASLQDLMIPSFSHVCTTLLDVGLILRLVNKFVSMEEGARSGGAVMKVAKLVDRYLAETAVDSGLALPDFVALARAVPSHTRSRDDGLYRAIDMYLKVHGGAITKEERRKVWSLIDINKLSQEACLHAAQNHRIPVRAVIQLLLSQQSKLINRHTDWSGSLSGQPSPPGFGLDRSARFSWKGENSSVQQMETKRLKEDVVRLQNQCMAMEMQIEKLLENKRSGSRYFSWKKLGRAKRVSEFEEESWAGFGLKVAVVRGTTPNRRKSMS